MRNAIRLKAFRNEISNAEMTQSIAALGQDIAAGRWVRPAFTAATVEQKAEELSSGHAATLGCRTLDIIHVAAALVIGGKGIRDLRPAASRSRQGGRLKRHALTMLRSSVGEVIQSILQQVAVPR